GGRAAASRVAAAHRRHRRAGRRAARVRGQRLGRGGDRARVRVPRPVPHAARAARRSRRAHAVRGPGPVAARRPRARAHRDVTLVLAVLAGLLAGRLVWLTLRPTFARPVFQRENYRGRALPTAAGAVIPVALLLVEGGRALLGHNDRLTGSRVL